MKPHFYVYCLMSEKPTVRHATLAEAQAEAERLSAKKPGRAFEILRCVGIAQCPKASTFWMDGEGPPREPEWRYFRDQPHDNSRYALYCRERHGIKEWASAGAPNWHPINQPLDIAAVEIPASELPLEIKP